MKTHGHPVLGGIAGLIFGLSLALLLLTLGTIALNSVLVVVLPVLFLVLGVVWGLWSPLGGSTTAGPPPATPVDPSAA